MSAVVTRSTCRAWLQATSSTIAVSRFVVLRVPRHPTLARRHLHATASSSSAVPPPTAEPPISNADTAPGIDGPAEGIIPETNDENVVVEDGPAIDPLSFKSLKSRVNHDTLEALTASPLNLETMTPVQARVTALLPELARPWDPEGIVPPEVPSPLPPRWKPPVIDPNAPRDMLVRAKTGTGKTFAYIIPAIESRLRYIQHNSKLAAIKAGLKFSSDLQERARRAYKRSCAGSLILAPTRELALQIANDALQLSKHQKDFEVIVLVGGSEKSRQMKDWTGSSRDLVVATPGRLRDLLENEPEFRKGFKDCPLLILDEADTLLSMGFRDDIDAIVSLLPRPPVRQTFLFSATMPRSVRQLASWVLSPNHTFIDAAPPEDSTSGDNELTTHSHIAQFRTVCSTAADQLPTLLKLLVHDQLIHGPNSKVIVFCPTVQVTELFSTLLHTLAEEFVSNWTARTMSMHSKMRQSERDKTRKLFHEAGKESDSKQTVLVTSDVSARGVDYPGVTRVIQIGVPSKEEIYVHRIGRMARGINSFVPRTGKATENAKLRADLLLLPWEAGYMDWKLTTLPIKPLSITELDQQLTSLSPQSSALTTELLKSALADLQVNFEPANIRSTAASLLGYYLPLTPSLRLQPEGVVAGISSWASESFNVTIPTIKRLPKLFTEAYQLSQSAKTKGLYVDGLKLDGPSPLGKAKNKNRSPWEGLDQRKRKPKRWH